MSAGVKVRNFPGRENGDDEFNSLTRITKDSKPTVVDLSITTMVNTGQTRLNAIHVVVSPGAAVDIRDGTTVLFTIPATASAGDRYEYDGARFSTDLNIPAATSGTLTVLWREGNFS